MEVKSARSLARILQRGTLRADIEGNRIVFSGGKAGVHSLALSASTKARILAHWQGYCENNGLPLPTKGQKVYFTTGSQNTPRVGRVVKVETATAHVRFRYKYGRETTRRVSFKDLHF